MILLKDTAIKNALLGDWDNAIKQNKLLLDDNPNDIDALNRLALASMARGDLKIAKEMYERVLEIDPLNPIALKNAKKIKEGNSKTNAFEISGQISNTFLEETGKTKVVILVNTAQPSLIQTLRAGQPIKLAIKRSKLFVCVNDNRYIGVLPDDIGQRLIKFIKSGNKYEAYMKSTNPHSLSVFIREVKKAKRYTNQPSFLSSKDQTSLNLLSGKKTKKQKNKNDTDHESSSDEDGEE